MYVGQTDYFTTASNY